MDDQLTNRIAKFLRSKTSTRRATESEGDYAVASTVGLVRDQNQDAALIVKARYGSRPERDFDLAVVCDGLGGMKHGGEASALGLSVFVSRVVRFSRASMEDRLVGGITEANDRLFGAFRGEGGTTLSAVVVRRSGPATVCHVGDSRVYAIAKQNIRQLTHDDTLQAALQKQPNSPPTHRDTRLLQFVGMGPDLEAQLLQLTISPATAYLLTSDGAHDVPLSFLERAMSAARSNPELARKLIELSEILGGLDNATAAILPSSLAEETERPSEGLDLQLLAPNGHLRIWIPQLADEQRGPPPSSAAPAQIKDSDEPPRKPEKPEGGQKGAPAKPKRARTRSGRKAKKAAEELPLSEPLTIQFPSSDEN